MENQFKWQVCISAPAGYPAHIYEGGLTTEDAYHSFSDGTIAVSNWGAVGSDMFNGVSSIPQLLHVKWLSYAEGCFYEVDTELDYDKILKLFKEGYQEKFGTLGIHKETYDEIITGFAPGGVVIVWLGSGTEQIEIGRYQGKKIVIPKEEIAKLDSDRSFIFDKALWKETLNEVRQNLNDDDDNNPDHIDIKKKLDNSPIPFGLWDSYRTKYYWKPTFDLGVSQGEHSKIWNSRFELYNGEKFNYYSEWLPQKDFKKNAILNFTSFGWTDNTQQNYGCEIWFDEDEIFSAFKEICGDNKDTPIEIIFRVNIPQTYVTVLLKGNGKEIGMKKLREDVYKTKVKFQ